MSTGISKIRKLYSQAALFWSAAGFGIDEHKEPQKAEHFGISVVEAMAFLSVPLVYRAGGHKEIVEHLKSGVLWSTQNDLLSYTSLFVRNPKKRLIIAKAARSRSRIFGLDRFSKSLLSLIS